MDVGVEISLYPLNQEYIPPIKDFIDRLNAEGGLRIVTNAMSTQIFGEYQTVMQRLVREMRTTFANQDKAIFVMKVLGPMAT